MKKSAVAIRHIHFETLGTFERELSIAGYALNYVDVGKTNISMVDPLKADLLVVLGGPIGVYETDAYPFLKTELALVRDRLDAGLPVLGICLGAQLIAAALGAKVAPSGIKEIGFAPVNLTEAGRFGPLRHLSGVPVLHWHGDAFELPEGATLLATTSAANQAFSMGANVLALQFHAEADTGNDLEPWLIGHAAELAGAGLDPRHIRDHARTHGVALRKAGRAAFAEWLEQIKHGAEQAG
ncbi:glutamine amidotransferase [Mesorhizobium kowhaii]|uniref:glutamine amidotransferase n=1 Tax=Mesorhizobium kowhaii TaxID=1300272 RepID=UPI0035E81758